MEKSLWQYCHLCSYTKFLQVVLRCNKRIDVYHGKGLARNLKCLQRGRCRLI